MRKPEPLPLPDEVTVTQLGEAGPLGGFRDHRRPVMPVIGNLAWAPMPSADQVEILDRFNGVPTLGVVTGSGGSHLFWRVAGHTHEHVTCWLYVPLQQGLPASRSEMLRVATTPGGYPVAG